MRIGRPHLVAILAAALACLAGPIAAQAGKTEKVKTKVAVDSVTGDADVLYTYGKVSAPDDRCLDNRRVQVYFAGNGNNLKFDIARTGRNGGWTAVHDINKVIEAGPFNTILVKVDERRIKAGGKTILCKPASTDYPLTD